MEVRADQALDLLLRHRLDRPTPLQHFANHQVDPQVPRMHEETRASERQGKGFIVIKNFMVHFEHFKLILNTFSLFLNILRPF